MFPPKAETFTPFNPSWAICTSSANSTAAQAARSSGEPTVSLPTPYGTAACRGILCKSGSTLASSSRTTHSIITTSPAFPWDHHHAPPADCHSVLVAGIAVCDSAHDLDLEVYQVWASAEDRALSEVQL